MINEQKIQSAATYQTSNWLRYLLIAITVEKIIQHIFVTLAFSFNWSGIRSTVAVNPDILLVLGALVAVLFMVSFYSLIKNQRWGVSLLTGLALFDMIGEFVAQGTLFIVLNFSFIFATLLLLITLIYSRRTQVKR